MDLATHAQAQVSALDYKAEDYYTQIALIEDEFKAALAEAHGLTPEVGELVSRQAYSLGHSDGYHEIASFYSDLAELAQAILAL